MKVLNVFCAFTLSFYLVFFYIELNGGKTLIYLEPISNLILGQLLTLLPYTKDAHIPFFLHKEIDRCRGMWELIDITGQETLSWIFW